MAALGLRCCMRVFSSCGKQWPLSAVACRPLTAAAPPAAEHGLQACGFSSCGSLALELRLSCCGAWAPPLRGMWDPPRPGPKPVSPALAGGLPTTAPPGKPWT